MGKFALQNIGFKSEKKHDRNRVFYSYKDIK